MGSRFHALAVDSTGSDDETSPPVSPTVPTSASTSATATPSSSIILSSPPTGASAPPASKKALKRAKQKAAAAGEAVTTPLSSIAATISEEPAQETSAPTSDLDEPGKDVIGGSSNGENGRGPRGHLPSRGASLASISTVSSRPSPSPSVTSESESELSEGEDLSAGVSSAAPTGTKATLAGRVPGLALNGRGPGNRRDSASTVDTAIAPGPVPGSPSASSFAGTVLGGRSGRESAGARGVADGEGPSGTIRARKLSRLGPSLAGKAIGEERDDSPPPTPPLGKEVDLQTSPGNSVGTAGAGRKEGKQQDHGKDHNPATKWKNAAIRSVWGFAMAGGFMGLLFMGPVYMVILVMVSQAIVYSELVSLFEHGYKTSHPDRESSPVSLRRQLAREKRKADREKWSKVMSWYFFAVTNYFLYGETIIYYFKHIVLVDAYFIPFARHHRFISFMLYVIGFVGFVTNLNRNHLRRQFGLFCWIHMTLVLIVFSSHFIVDNILEGLIWLWVPASLVIMNDIMAYVFGMLFGRTQLIKLSPKKTVEGFVGAFFSTVIFSYFWATLFMRYPYMICPVRDLGSSAFSPTSCAPNNVFVWREYHVPHSVTEPLHIPQTSIPWAPFQLHAVVMAVFASLVAPFGGFFASGFKRAFNIKDFGDSIPGHGGLTDRFDCQFLMGLFTYVYYSSLIREHHVSIGAVLQTITTGLTVDEQVEVLKDLQKYLVGQGIKF